MALPFATRTRYCPSRGNTRFFGAAIAPRGAIRCAARLSCPYGAQYAALFARHPPQPLTRRCRFRAPRWHASCSGHAIIEFAGAIALFIALSSASHIVYRSLPQRRCHDEISHNCFFALLCALCDASMGAKQCTRPDPLRSFRSPWRRHTGTIQTHRQHNAQRRQRQDLQLRSSPYHSIFRRDSFGRLSAHTVVASRRHLFMPIRHHG